jgi:undecaprenyl-diphosphatase
MKNAMSNLISKRKKVLIKIGLFLFIVFIALTYFVARERLISFDFDSTVRLQDNIPRRFDNSFSSFSILGSFEVTLLIVFLIAVAGGLSKPRRFLLLVWFPLFHVIEIVFKTIIDQVGPPFMFHRYSLGFHFPSSYVNSDFYSFPSGHVGRTAFIVGLLIYIVVQSRFKKLYKLVLLSLFLLILGVMMVSRVYLGEHWTTDVIGGLLLGLSFGLFAAVVW